MEKDMTLVMPVTAAPTRAARLSIWSAAVFVALLASLHVIQPELDPAWHFISEYALGDYGWLMAVAFGCFALSWLALFVALRSHARCPRGRIGLGLMLVSAAGLILAAVFTTDPITATPGELTAEGNLHSLGGMLGMAMPFAVLLVSYSLRRNPYWRPVRRSVGWAAALAVAGFVLAFVSTGWMLAQNGGSFGPGAPVGWPNRLEVLAYSLWLVVVTRGALRASG